MKILETKNLTKKFPGVIAVNELNFDLEAGEVHGLAGENGAGKSTLIKMLSGVHQPTSGKILIQGKEVNFQSPKEASDYIGVVHQENELVSHFTGYENIFLGLEETKMGFLNKKAMKKNADKIISGYDLNVDLDIAVKNMGSGKQELLNIFKVVFIDPDIVIFDEPTAPLSENETEILFRLIKELKEKGKAIIYISHHLTEILELADRITVLRNGKKVTTVKNVEIDEKQLIKYMIDREIDVQYPKIKTKIGEKLFEVSSYNSREFSDINFNIRSSEIVGFAGLVGAGRTELAQEIFMKFKKRQKEIKLYSEEKRLAMIPENRRKDGLITSLSVKDNLILPHLEELCNMGFLQNMKVNNYSSSIIEKLSIKISSPLQEVKTLSGGNQQKVSIGKWMGEEADIWIFDEPTKGIDVDTKKEIYNIMGNLAKEGSGIWFISSDLRELIPIVDRIYVMYNFSIVGEFTPPFSKENILSTMMGEN